MPTLVKPLDSSSAYTYCPICRDNGNPNSLLQRDSVGAISCALGHRPGHNMILTPDSGTSGLAPMTADAVKLVDVEIEQPLITDIKWPIWCQPKTKQMIEEKYKGRVMATISTLLMALADGSLIMITGDQGRQLKKHGIKSGAEMLSFIEATKSMEKERDEAISQVTKFMKMVQSAQQSE